VSAKRHTLTRRRRRPAKRRAVPATGLERKLLQVKLASLTQANLRLHQAGVGGDSPLRKRIVSAMLRTENCLLGVRDRDYPPGWEDDR
jgi:hypothetical protein